MTNDEMIAAAFEQELTEEIAECEALPDRRFSYGFERKMKKLLQGSIGGHNRTSRPHIGKRLTAAVITACSLLLLMGAAATTYVLWDNFYMQDLSLYTLLNITDVESCPNTLEYHYEITADLSGFTENVLSDDEYLFFVEYQNKEEGIRISFTQETKHGLTKMLNTEDKDSPIAVTVNGCNGVYCETKYDSYVLIWDTGDYLIELIVHGIGKNELFSLAETVQKVE